jgi:UDP-glucose 4-epimerase
MPHSSTALVTGASGFLGWALVPRLLASGYEVHATSRSKMVHEHPHVTWHQLDPTDISAVRHILAMIRPSHIVHLSGCADGKRRLELAVPTLLANAVSTVHLLTAATEVGCDRFVVAASMEEPGVGGNPGWANSPYAASKWTSTMYGQMFHRSFGLPVVALRPFLVYGPGPQDAGKLIPYVISSLLRGQQPKLSSGRRKVDAVYINDVAEAFVAALAEPRAIGRVLDIGTGVLLPIRQLALSIARQIGSGVPLDFDGRLDRPNEFSPAADVEATLQTIGWKARTALDEGIRRTVAWYRQRLAVGTGVPPLGRSAQAS